MKSVDILLVEDNPGDARLTREALAHSSMPSTLYDVRDGEQAMAFLRRQGPYASAPTPRLVLLDLNLPRLGGREVLEDMKRDPALQHIPVVVLTSSEAEEDILRSYRLHANCFITKPADLEDLSRVLEGIGQFWFNLVKLPPEVRA
ncbi:MAG: response regulator [Acidobacteria bacterium]|nr:response regulator [Acidobacteriota bacterium]